MKKNGRKTSTKENQGQLLVWYPNKLYFWHGKIVSSNKADFNGLLLTQIDSFGLGRLRE